MKASLTRLPSPKTVRFSPSLLSACPADSLPLRPHHSKCPLAFLKVLPPDTSLPQGSPFFFWASLGQSHLSQLWRAGVQLWSAALTSLTDSPSPGSSLLVLSSGAQTHHFARMLTQSHASFVYWRRTFKRLRIMRLPWIFP